VGVVSRGTPAWEASYDAGLHNVVDPRGNYWEICFAGRGKSGTGVMVDDHRSVDCMYLRRGT